MEKLKTDLGAVNPETVDLNRIVTQSAGLVDKAAAEMPKYICHKQVWALQIKKREGNTLYFMDQTYTPIKVDPIIFSRYTPVCGDYYVVYEDGYKSISPERVFEEGYHRAK